MGRLSSEEVQQFLDRYRDPEEARRLLMEMGMIDNMEKHVLSSAEMPTNLKEPLEQWRSEGRGVLFF